ncbi:MAG: cell filamentation protein Fic, partial [Chloroflexi bacterium]
KIWYLYEFLTGNTLPLDDVKQGNYVDLLEEDKYYTAPPRPIRRQRVNDNLLGNRYFCPIVRRTETLRQFEASNFPERCRQLIAGYPEVILKRTVGFLYTKETLSSFEIERVKLSPERTERFVQLLHLAAEEDFCNKEALIALQNHIVVDERFHDKDYRTNQNYVGENHPIRGAIIHFASPKPNDLPDLMEGLLAAHQRMEEGNIAPVVHAATIAYGFVFMHPFEDGNGRIHRFLIHNILARKGFTPEGVIFPVSAVMLRNMKAYDASLEAFSKPLMRLVKYELDENGVLTIHSDTAIWYRYIDMTPQVEALFNFIENTLEQELAQEFAYLERYDKAQRAIRAIVNDMPDNKVDLFIKLCLQNNGKLSAKKRKKFFAQFTDEEIAKMEMAIKEVLDEGKDITPAPKS